MWHVSRDGATSGPFSEVQLREMIQTNLLHASDYVWKEGMSDWKTVQVVFGITPSSPPPPTSPRGAQNPYGNQPFPSHPVKGSSSSSVEKLPAAILAILLGSLGVHKFYMGYTTQGIIMLAVTLLTFGLGAFAMTIVSIIEGVLYISMPDEQFNEVYVVGEKPWF